MEPVPNLSDKKIIFWEDQGLLQYSVAYWLQKKLDCKMYAIIDSTDRPKVFFKNQKLVKFDKIWFFHEHIAKNKIPDIDYLKDVEKKYNLHLWLLAANERLFYGYYDYHIFSENEVLSILEQEIKLFESILDQIKPDFLVTTTNMHHNHLFYQICVAKKIKVLFMTPTRLGGRCMMSHDADTLPSQLNLPNPKNDLTFNELQKYQKNFNLFNESEKFIEGFSHSKFNLIKAAFQFLFVSNNSNIDTHYSYYGRTKFRVLINSIFDVIKTKYRTKFIEKIFLKQIPDVDFVFFPLHLDPERTLLLHAPFYLNQLEIIRNIAKSLPIGYKLFVKEHITMITRSWRSTDFYKELSKIPNVILIHPSIHPEEILKKCSLVVTINGTAGFDAAFYQKPSIVFGDVLYQNLSSTTTVKNFESLPTEIRKSLEKKVDLHELNQFLNLLESNSFKFKWNLFGTHVQQHFYMNGNLTDVEISNTQMESFLNLNQELLAPLVDEYFKKIIQELNN